MEPFITIIGGRNLRVPYQYSLSWSKLTLYLFEPKWSNIKTWQIRYQTHRHQIECEIISFLQIFKFMQVIFLNKDESWLYMPLETTCGGIGPQKQILNWCAKQQLKNGCIINNTKSWGHTKLSISTLFSLIYLFKNFFTSLIYLIWCKLSMNFTLLNPSFDTRY